MVEFWLVLFTYGLWGFGSFGASSFWFSVSICILLERRFTRASIYSLFEFCEFTCQLCGGWKLSIALTSGISTRIKAAIYGIYYVVIIIQGTCVIPLLLRVQVTRLEYRHI